jgi:thiol-disulfide isomerase/thioredoxin
MESKYLLRFFVIILFNCMIAITQVLGGQSGALDSGYAPTDIPFYDLKGNKHYLEEMDGKVFLVVFWAGWCHSCISQIDQLDNLKKDFKKIPFEIIMISEDFAGPEHIQSVFTKYDIRHLIPYYDMNQNLFNAFGVESLPQAFLINANGERVLNFSGEIKWFEDAIRKQILSFIQGAYEIPRNSYVPDKISLKINKR